MYNKAMKYVRYMPCQVYAMYMYGIYLSSPISSLIFVLQQNKDETATADNYQGRPLGHVIAHQKHVLLNSFKSQVHTRCHISSAARLLAVWSPTRAGMFRTWSFGGSFLFLRLKALQLEAGVCQRSTTRC
jgi:hypothetical protein